MRVLNLYAGLGGNRKLWRDCDVTAVEMDEKIASVYSRLNPDDEVVVGDAHQYLLEHYKEYDFIWSSPPCQSHSRMIRGGKNRKPRYADLRLYEEILFLKHNYSGLWVVENVRPYYTPLVSPVKEMGRHLFWANFYITGMENPPKQPANFINKTNLQGKRALMDWLGIHYEENIYYGNNHCPAQILRNCVHPLVGLHVFECQKLTQSFF